MKVALVHLSPPRRGEVEEVDGDRVVLGSDEACDVHLPADLLGLPAERHAEVVRDGEALLVRDLGSGSGTLVNGYRVGEVRLKNGDVVELGGGGPRLRVAIADEPTRSRGLADALRSVAGPEAPSATRKLARALLVVLAASLLVSAAVLVHGGLSRGRIQKEIGQLRGQLSADQAARLALLRSVTAERRRGAEEQARREAAVRERIEALREREEALRRRLSDAEADASLRSTELNDLRRQLGEAHQRQSELSSERSVAERIVRERQGGVGFVEGVYDYVDAEGNPARFSTPPAADAAAAGGEAAAEPGGATLRFVYTGTGFLVSSAGHVLTNRHVAEPWWKDERAAKLKALGYTPRRQALRIYFPGIPEPLPLSVERVAETADVALGRVTLPAGVRPPVLPLETGGPAPSPGQGIVLLGYPTGLDALLARLDDAVVEEVVTAAAADPERVSRELARRGMIRPLATQGHLGDVLPNQLVYDAATTVGGSGGPVFNAAGRVIGVNAAILTGFGGASFGVPVRLALALLPPDRPRRR